MSAQAMATAAKRCFVISPIGKKRSAIRGHADEVFHLIIRPAVESFGIEPVRADQEATPGKISEQMFRAILQDDFCVALLTLANPNVFYEIAVAQCNKRPVIMLNRRGDPIPFDGADFRAVEYPRTLTANSAAEAVEELREQIRRVIDGRWEPPKIYGDLKPFSWLSEADVQRLVETSRPKPLESGLAVQFRVAGTGCTLDFLTGDLERAMEDRPVDVVVSSENVDLQPARYYDPSVSGTLRYLDATQNAGHPITDNLGAALDQEIRTRDLKLPVKAGFVVPTPTTKLRELGVRYVFHAASAEGVVGVGYVPNELAISVCVRSAYKAFREVAKSDPIASILFPLLGAGSAKLPPAAAAKQMLPEIVRGIKATPACSMTRIVARVQSHLDALLEVAATSADLERL